MTLAPRVTPNAKVIGEPGTVSRALACEVSYLITCFSHSGWIASNTSSLSAFGCFESLDLGVHDVALSAFWRFGARVGHIGTAPLTAREGCAGAESQAD